eukprot:Amastigsp_a512790_103.p4 type:complete len:105 gc:universal Amastigsp_a512790_103:1166-852(-)
MYESESTARCSSPSSASGNLRMAATPVSCASCSPDVCCVEKMRTSPPFARTLSTRSTYCARFARSAARKSSSVTIRTAIALTSLARLTGLYPYCARGSSTRSTS